MNKIQEICKSFEDELGTKILDKDEIGVQEEVYKKSHTTNRKAYIMSYYCQLESSDLEPLRKKLTLIKEVSKFFIYAMSRKDTFFKFAELDATLQEIVTVNKKAALAAWLNQTLEKVVAKSA
jgi:hypothetical protein